MNSSPRTVINVGPPPAGPYSHAVSAGGLVYVSGVVADDGGGGTVGKGDVAAQTATVLERLAERLAAAGSSLSQAVCVTVYLRSAADFAAGCVCRRGTGTLPGSGGCMRGALVAAPLSGAPECGPS